MRLLHTADWHLNERLGPISRQPDIRARMEEIASYLDRYSVDVMLVAGDLFSDYVRLDEVRDALGDVQELFKPFLTRGGTMVAISGNHDKEALFNLIHTALDLACPLDPREPGPRPAGRLYLAARPTCLRLRDRAGLEVQFALLPYPTSARYLRGEETDYTGGDERNHRLHSALVRKLQEFYQQAIDPRLHSVLVSHLHVRGTEIHNLYHLSECEDVVFDPVDILHPWAYAALGHIHKPQLLCGSGHIRYSGSIERFDYAERSDDKGAVLAEIGPTGLVGEPEVLPLSATPIYRIEITDPGAEIPPLKERYPHAGRALVSYRVLYRPGEHNREAIRHELEALFPRCYRAEFVSVGSDLDERAPQLTGSERDVSGTVRSYLEERLAQDPDRDDLLALAAQLQLETEAIG
jgi:exonuclease SbcD